EMGASFFSGNNCVIESGQFPNDFLLGVSTAASDIQYRRQMRSRMSKPITVVGNPPIRIEAKQSAEVDNGSPSLPLFFTRILLNDVFSMSFLPSAHISFYAAVFMAFLSLNLNPLFGSALALIVSSLLILLLLIALKRALIGNRWGVDHSTQFWSWKHFAYFFVQDCFFSWCRVPLGFSAGTLLSNPILRQMGCKIGRRTLVMDPMQASDWNAVDFGDDCIVAGFLQFHTFEDMVLKVKRTEIGNRSSINFGATIMSGAKLEEDTTVLPLAMALKEMQLPPGLYQGSPAELVSTGHLEKDG
ncbi:MAG: hypothetical protein ACR2O8_03730, partial [Rhizobiaceae bacterium]